MVVDVLPGIVVMPDSTGLAVISDCDPRSSARLSSWCFLSGASLDEQVPQIDSQNPAHLPRLVNDEAGDSVNVKVRFKEWR